MTEHMLYNDHKVARQNTMCEQRNRLEITVSHIGEDSESIFEGRSPSPMLKISDKSVQKPLSLSVQEAIVDSAHSSRKTESLELQREPK